MKYISNFLIYFLFISSSIFSQPGIQWQKCLGGSGDDGAASIQQTTDGGFIIAGTSISDNGDVTGHHWGNDYWVVKLDNTNVIQWEKSYGGTEDDEAHSIQQTSDGGYIVAGTSRSNDGDVTGNNGSFGTYDSWIIKLDPFGAIQWEKSLGGSSNESANFIRQTIDGGYIVAGNTSSNDSDVTSNHGDDDCWIVKLDNAGSIQWDKSLGGTLWEVAASIQQTSDGGYVFAGTVQSTDGDVIGNHGGTSDCWIAKLDQVGSLIWQKTLGGSGFDLGGSIQQTTDGGYIFLGSTESNDGNVSGNHGGFEDFWAVKLDSSRTIQWQIALGGSGDDGSANIQQTSDGGYIATGYSESDDGDISGHHGVSYMPDVWVVRLNNSGSILWQKSLGGTLDEGGSSIQQTNDGGFIIAGSTGSWDGDVTGLHGNNSDFWIIKLNPTVNVNEIENSVFDFQINPNPFSDLTTISFIIPTSKANIEIHDIQGRLIKKIDTKNLNAGSNKIEWDATNENGMRTGDGLYFVTIYSNEIIETKLISVSTK